MVLRVQFQEIFFQKSASSLKLHQLEFIIQLCTQANLNSNSTFLGGNIVTHRFKKKITAFSIGSVHAKSLQLCLTLYKPMYCSLPGSSIHGDSPSKNTGMGCRALLQGIFLTQGLNSCLLQLPALASRFFTTSTSWEAQWQCGTTYTLT